MIPAFADLLRCPRSGQRLSIVEAQAGQHGRIRHGTLETADGGARYPIREYVPMFVGTADYAESFSHQWRRWSVANLERAAPAVPLMAHYDHKFATITGFGRDAIAGRTVIEFGAGSGLFAPPVRARGGRFVGLDLGDAIVEAQAYHLADPDVQFVRGDALQPPFARASADAAFSIGVFHHTPDPAGALAAMMATIAPGGRFALSVYSKDGYHGQRSVARLRRVYAALPGPDRETFASGYAVVAAKLLHTVIGLQSRDPRRVEALAKLQGALAPSFNDPSAPWRAAVLYDAITPTFASTHTAEEVAGWLRAGGAATLEPRPWPSIAFTGTLAA